MLFYVVISSRQDETKWWPTLITVTFPHCCKTHHRKLEPQGLRTRCFHQLLGRPTAALHHPWKPVQTSHVTPRGGPPIAMFSHLLATPHQMRILTVYDGWRRCFPPTTRRSHVPAFLGANVSACIREHCSGTRKRCPYGEAAASSGWISATQETSLFGWISIPCGLAPREPHRVLRVGSEYKF